MCLAEVPGEVLLPTAIYARLSDKNSGKDDDGAAIENQIEVCKDYIRDTMDLELTKVYTDNGWTGTNMNRPAFEELMDAVRTGEIKAIVVRDLSRFARNYLETGFYLEKIFPRLGIRFISVKEQLDTMNAEDDANALLIKIQSLINDLYAKDISRKIHAVYKVQKEEKTFSWRSIPYGYIWNEDHTAIIPEEETAAVVRQIFDWRLEGFGCYRIAVMLNERGVPTYWSRRNGEKHQWIAATVRDISKNPAYIGNKVWGRKRKELYKGIKKERTPESEWVVVENDHEAIISKEAFEKVQELRREGKEKYRAALERNADLRSVCVDKLKGKAFCGDCGNRLYYKPDIIYSGKERRCNGGEYYCRTDIKNQECPFHCIKQWKMEKNILSAIKMQIKTVLDFDRVKDEYRKSTTEKVRRLQNVILEQRRSLRNVQAKRQRLYEDYVEGTLNSDEYALAKCTYDKEYENITSSMEKAIDEKKKYSENLSLKRKCMDMIRKIKNTDELTQEMADMMVEKVLFYKGGAIEVVMKYQDVFKEVEEYCNNLKGETAYE